MANNERQLDLILGYTTELDNHFFLWEQLLVCKLVLSMYVILGIWCFEI